MTEERTGDCSYTACGGSCPSNKVETYKIPAQCGSGTFQRRCCSPQYYPDVLILIDKGAGSVMQSFERSFDLPYADYSLLEEPFTNARLVKALPGELQCSCADALMCRGLLNQYRQLRRQLGPILSMSQQSSTCFSFRQGSCVCYEGRACDTRPIISNGPVRAGAWQRLIMSGCQTQCSAACSGSLTVRQSGRLGQILCGTVRQR
jgi:hypothetical protein